MKKTSAQKRMTEANEENGGGITPSRPSLPFVEKLSPRPAESGGAHSSAAPGQVSTTEPESLARFGGQLAARPPEGALVVADDEDAVMGLQLEMQWERAIGGQRDQLIFGAMMIKLRARLSARGQPGKGGHDLKKGEGLEGWLNEHAPKVTRGTAYRLLEIAEGVQELCKIGKRVDLEELLGAAVEDLPEKLAAKRAEIEKLIEGKSQRQLLLQFGERSDGRSKNPGGLRPHLEFLRPWLAQEYPEHPEYLEMLFGDLPAEVQKRFRAEGERYKNRLTVAQKEEIARESAARDWIESAPAALNAALDAQLYNLGTPEQLTPLEHALSDLLTAVRKHVRECAAHPSPALKGK